MTPYRPVLATLGYVFSPARDAVLLVHRNARPADAHFGKFNGLGGKLEPGEDIVAGMRREIHEEAGLTCDELHLAATISWPGFGGGDAADWFGFLFRVTRFTGTPPARNAEGELRWVSLGEVLALPLWPGDRHFLPMILDAGAPPFHGVMPYAGGEPVAWSFSR